VASVCAGNFVEDEVISLNKKLQLVFVHLHLSHYGAAVID